MRQISRAKRKTDAGGATSAQIAIQEVILAIPRGKVASYGEVAAAAGFPGYHRQVAQVLRKFGRALPWHRVLGAGGVIKNVGENALEQRLRLEMEGVRFRGAKVDLSLHQYSFE